MRAHVLLVHGAWHGAWCWEEKLAPWLRAQGHRVQALDLPGHGRSGPARLPAIPIRAYVDKVAECVSASRVPVIVAGHSMGGFVVQKLMERRPARLAGVALFASVPPSGVIGVVLRLLRHRPLDLARAVVGMDLYRLVRAPQLAQAMFYAGLTDAALGERYWGRLQNESFRAFLDMLVLDLPRPSRVDPALPKWVIGGQLDAVFPPREIVRTAKTYGVAPVFYPCGHNLMLDADWEAVARDFSAWIDSLIERA